MARIEAVVTRHRNNAGGSVAVFYVETAEELQQTSFLLEKILDASAHDLKNGTMILVNHQAE
ncbi:hypothetical protein IDH44_08265 [Paenibacillus sp. IB182496]|uniref:Uncharacterized protein n=1 Tax=Paenibacillus sabuli TaxID=2772509 RepID=A0A927BTL4_9BACL|nr:hypothetical protein [Paenibacillus sabuli]MBD2845183.1 hypothetical protein [Paenibacillus sabuli]